MSEWIRPEALVCRMTSLPCSSCCWISWMVLTPQQCSALRACPHPAPPCLLCLWFLMTKCIETIGWTLPSIRRHSEGSLCGSGPQDFRQLTKQLLLALDWLAAMLFSPTGKAVRVSRAELGGMATAVCSPPNTLVPHQSRPEVFLFPISAFYTTGHYYIVFVPSGLILAFSKKKKKNLSGCKVYASCLGQIICLYNA